MELEIYLDIDGSAVTPWWTPELAEILCALCGGGRCDFCLNNNPWCG